MSRKIRMMTGSLMVLIFMSLIISCASTPKSASTGEYVDDSVITAKVKALLIEDEILKAFQISVETYKSIVQLSGFVDTQATINRAGEIARSVSGVKSVRNDLILK